MKPAQLCETCTTVIRNGLVVSAGEIRPLDIVVRGERITALIARGSTDPRDGDVAIDAKGMVIVPGAIDGHTHFVQNERDGGSPEGSEGFEQGGRGAAAGGVTTIIEMPQAQPSTTDGATFRRKRELAGRRAIVDFAMWGGIVPDQAEASIQEQAAEGAAGFKAFLCSSDPALPAIDDAQFLTSLHCVKETHRLMGLHAENEALLQARLAAMARAGRADPMAHAESRPPIVEIEAVSRCALFARVTGAHVHIVHLSTGGGADIVAAAKADGVNITCETCPHYLVLDHSDLERLGPLARCAPSIRARDDVERLWSHLAAGTIDCVTTDHCGSALSARLRGRDNIFEAPLGLPGIETLVPLFATEARARDVSWPAIASLIASSPARLWCLAPRKGTIVPGADADLTIIDPASEWTIRGGDLHHAHRWTPYDGRVVSCRVVRTLRRGQTIYEDGRGVLAEPGSGQFIPAIAGQSSAAVVG